MTTTADDARRAMVMMDLSSSRSVSPDVSSGQAASMSSSITRDAELPVVGGMPSTRLPLVTRVLLIVTGVISAVFLLAGRQPELSDLPVLRFYLLLPLIGGVLALARLTSGHLRAPQRSTLVYCLMCFALVSWGLSGLWIFVLNARSAAVPEFPSAGDLGFIAGGILWTASIWILYEEVVTDFLSEVEANAFLLSAMSVATIFVLSIAGGSDLLEAIKAGGNTVQMVALAYPLIYGFNVVMLLRLVHAERRRNMVGSGRPLVVMVWGLLFLYLAQMTWSTTVILNYRLESSPSIDRTGDAPQVLYIVAYVILALGIVSYPLPEPRPPGPTGPRWRWWGSAQS